MDLTGFVTAHRSMILERWRQLIFDSYPPEAARFFRGERDRFHNPVGFTILRSTEVVFDGVLLDSPRASVAEALEAMVRLRAVQDHSPSQAVAFVFWLKRALRQALDQEPLAEDVHSQLTGLEERIDRLAASAFDLYVECRERIHEIKTNEIRRKTASLLRQLEDPERTTASGDLRRPEGGCEP